ncbi:MAG: hypothetical protein V7739_01235 [Motiliproteus sp.]
MKVQVGLPDAAANTGSVQSPLQFKKIGSTGNIDGRNEGAGTLTAITWIKRTHQEITMGIENVACPHCGNPEQFGNVPMGLQLIKVEGKRDRYQSSESDQNENRCTACKQRFYTITTKRDR